MKPLTLQGATRKAAIHIGVAADIIGALVLSIRRPALESPGRGLLAPQNIPLAVFVILIITGAEQHSARFDITSIVLFALSGLVFLRCSFYLPPSGTSSDSYSVLSYGALVFQFSCVVATYVWKRIRITRALGTCVIVVFAATAAGYAYTYSFSAHPKDSPKAEAAVILGEAVYGKHNPSPILRGRLNEALRIFKAGEVKKLVTTGAGQAGVEAWYLHSKGVPDSDIVSEDGTHCTCEQANFIRTVLVDSLDMRRIIVVTNTWHLPRALLMCHWQGVNARGVASRHSLPLATNLFYRFREAGALQVYILFGA